MSSKIKGSPEDDSPDPMSRRDANILKGLGLYIASVLTILLIFFVPSLGTNSSQEDRIDATLKALVVAQLTNCHADYGFRIQYKIRGEAEKKFLDLFLTLAKTQVANGEDPKGLSQAFIDEFQPLTENIHIVSVPDCNESAKKLTRTLEMTGVDIPPVPFDIPGQSNR